MCDEYSHKYAYRYRIFDLYFKESRVHDIHICVFLLPFNTALGGNVLKLTET